MARPISAPGKPLAEDLGEKHHEGHGADTGNDAGGAENHHCMPGGEERLAPDHEKERDGPDQPLAVAVRRAPAGMETKTPGNAKRLIRSPASANETFSSETMAPRSGGTDCRVMANPSIAR